MVSKTPESLSMENFIDQRRAFMKQKYTIMKSDDKSKLIIQEFAELDKDMMSLLCEETYDYQKIQSAISHGREALVSALRTPNMYPAKIYADKIADSVISLHDAPDQNTTEVLFDDFDYLASSRKKEKVVEEIEEEAAEIDDLLDDEFEEEYDEKPSIDNVNPSLRVDDDDITDFEEES